MIYNDRVVGSGDYRRRTFSLTLKGGSMLWRMLVKIAMNVIVSLIVELVIVAVRTLVVD